MALCHRQKNFARLLLPPLSFLICSLLPPPTFQQKKEPFLSLLCPIPLPSPSPSHFTSIIISFLPSSPSCCYFSCHQHRPPVSCSEPTARPRIRSWPRFALSRCCCRGGGRLCLVFLLPKSLPFLGFGALGEGGGRGVLVFLVGRNLGIWREGEFFFFVSLSDSAWSVGGAAGAAAPAMEAITMSPSSVSSHHLDVDAASTSEDMSSLQEGLLFSDSLKDLRNLRSQLYSAAEYFEVFYRNNSQKYTVMTSLKDYTVEALVSTVDHLGFVSYKVDNLVKERSDEVNETEFRVSSVEQRVRICQQTIDQEGRSQQSLLIRAPKYHRRYILPGADIVESAIHPVSEPPRYSRQHMSRKMHKSQSISTPVGRQSTMRSVRSPSPSARGTHHRSRSLSPSRKARAKSPSPQIINTQTKETRAGSPIPNSNPLARSATVARRPPVHPKHFRQTSMQLHSDWSNHKEQEKSSSKGRGFLKSLLTRRRWRNDESLYSYLDEY